jgi:hypothetical protein
MTFKKAPVSKQEHGQQGGLGALRGPPRPKKGSSDKFSLGVAVPPSQKPLTSATPTPRGEARFVPPATPALLAP